MSILPLSIDYTSMNGQERGGYSMNMLVEKCDLQCNEFRRMSEDFRIELPAALCKQFQDFGISSFYIGRMIDTQAIIKEY
jgi:hypothetical protein